MAAPAQDTADAGGDDAFLRASAAATLESCLPDYHEHEITPATRLLEKRREIKALAAGLGDLKAAFDTRMEHLANRRADLRRKEAMLVESLAKFDKFIKENDSKRARALRKAHDERAVRDLRVADIAKLRDLMASLNAVRLQQEESKALGTRYQRYLESVMEHSEGFLEIRDILARYDALQATNDELKDRAHAAQDLCERGRAELQLRVDDLNNQVLYRNNAIANLKLRLEDLEARSLAWQHCIEDSVQRATQKSLELGQIRMATNNLFNLVKMHLSNRVSATSNTVSQLDKIQQFILDLSDITVNGSGSGSGTGNAPNDAPDAPAAAGQLPLSPPVASSSSSLSSIPPAAVVASATASSPLGD